MKNNTFPIKGFIPVSLLDWPGQISSMVFVGGCNFRCSFCYNTELVLNPEKLVTIDEEDVFNHLIKKKNWIDAVVISGGEPTLHKGLEDFCKKIKKLGLLVQIQTNGTNPDVLESLLKKNLVDFLAMDIKGPLKKYEKIVGAKVDTQKIKESVDLIKNAKIESEFRTTLVPGLINKNDIKEIGGWLGPKCDVPYFLQQFRNEKTLDPTLSKTKPYSDLELNEVLEIAKKYFKKVEIRGV